MNKVMLALDGKKTYIFILLGILSVLAHTMGYIDQPTMLSFLSLFGFGGLAGLRDAISKIEDHVLPVEVIQTVTATPVPPPPHTITQDGHTYVLQETPVQNVPPQA